MTATIPRVPRPRGELPPRTARRLSRLAHECAQAEQAYREAAVDALAEGGSFSEVSKATGLSTNTLQRWKREASDD